LPKQIFPRGRVARVILVAMLVMPAGCMFVANPSRASIPRPPATLSARDVSFPSSSGSRIRGWLARGRAGKGAVLLLHGVGSNRTSMEARAKFLHDAGFTVLAPDFEGHGESSGETVSYGARESLDAAAALDFLRHEAPGERIGVIGVSMGGAATLLGPAPLPADAFVLESVYPTIRQAVGNRLGTWFGPLGGVGRLFTSAVIGMIHSKTGVSESELAPISRIGAIRGPLLLISGTKDQYTPIAEAESLFARAPDPKTFWAVAGAEHEDLYAFERGEYERRVGDFLARWLRD
jgi:uncharacterized protein